MATVEIVAIGSELLLGQIVDTNSSWMANRLAGLGLDLFYTSTVGDNPARMKSVISHALKRSDAVITSGGLGPTQDDLTREVVAESTGRNLWLVPELVDEMNQRFRSRGFIMTKNNERQAYIPEGAIPIHNPNGTAPAFALDINDTVLFALPGVPNEMKWLFDNEVTPYLRKKFDLNEMITYKILKISEVGESVVDDKIGHLIASSVNPTVGVLAHPGQVDIRIAAKASSKKAAADLIAPIEAEVFQLLGKHVFATDDESMEDSVGALLRKKNLTVAVYENLTGGQISERLQRASPTHFVEGVISNKDSVIQRILASSTQTSNSKILLKNANGLVDELAWAIRSLAGTDIGIAVHGTPDKKDSAQNLGRGKTLISITNGNDFRRRTYNFAGRTAPDQTRISLNTLELLRLMLKKK